MTIQCPQYEKRSMDIMQSEGKKMEKIIKETCFTIINGPTHIYSLNHTYKHILYKYLSSIPIDNWMENHRPSSCLSRVKTASSNLIMNVVPLCHRAVTLAG